MAKKRIYAFGANFLMDNQEGLLMDVRLTPDAGASERDAAPGTRRITVVSDRGYDTRGSCAERRKSWVTPHVAQKHGSAIDQRTTRHAGYRISQQSKERIEKSSAG